MRTLLAVAIAMAPPEPPSPMITATFGTPRDKLRLGRARDGLGLAALLRLDARIGAGRVDEGEDGKLEAVGKLHEADRLAVALGPGHAEIVADAGLRRGALLLAEDADRLAPKAAEAADDGLVLGKFAVAGERREILDQPGAVVRRNAAVADGARRGSSAMA